jgi:TonB family protein
LHIAHCAQCLAELGGEHELERAAETVGAARESEVWEPQLGSIVRRRSRSLSPLVRFAAAFALTFAAASAVLHYVTVPAAPLRAFAPPSAQSIAAAAHVVPQRQAATAQRKLTVYHNVVQIARAPLSAATAPPSGVAQTAAKAPEIAAVTVYPQTPPQSAHHSSVPVWRDPMWRTVARTTTTSLSETSPQRVSSAESLSLGSFRSNTNDPRPVGGETAINPQPPMIAYAEGAEGTTAFEVLVDDRGLPTKCVITKPAGYRFLDEAVCKAAMKARYSPKTVDGRPVAGVYRDAFTFRVTSDASDGLPKAIP